MSDSDADVGEWPLQRLMTEVVGSGHKSADDMTRDQAREAMARILGGDPDPTTLGAFWLANRWKRNTPTELAGFLDVMAEQSVEYGVPEADPVDCGAAYDGKHTTAILGVAAGCVAAAAGTPIVVHSGDRVPTQKLPAYKHVLDALDVRTDLEPTESAAMVDRCGFGFYYQPRFNPGVHDLHERRDRMGVRTFCNTIETLANPARCRVHLGSFYHLPFAKRMVETLEESDSATAERVVMFQGLEGYDDVRPGSTIVAEWDGGGEITDFEIETADFGMAIDGDDLAVEDIATDSARVTEAVVAGEREGPFRDAVALNAALRLYAGEAASDLEEGLSMARTAIENGEAAAVLEALQEF